MPASPGAKFYKSDLHIHTPKSHDYQDKNVQPEALVKEALSKQFGIIGITDHNSAEWVDVVRSAAKGTGLAIFPGVEISTPICHILALFDPATPKSVLDDLLSSVGIPTEKRGKEDAVSEDLESVLKKISDKGGLAIAAHANGSKGLLQNEGSGQYRLKVFHRDDLSAVEFTQEKDVKKFIGGAVPGYDPKACVQGSDAHCLSEIGRRYTFLKMDGASLRGVEQALLDYEVRVRFEWEKPVQAAYPRIASVRVNQGFFAGEAFNFHPGLNCFVGGRGVGKSTIIEFMRYGFGDISSIPDIAEDTNGKLAVLLGEGGSILIEYLDADGELKTVEVEFGGDTPTRTIKDSAGNPTVLISPPVFFSQGELARIASIPVAQMGLLDRYLDLGQESFDEKKSVDQLRVNAEKLEAADTQEKKIAEEIDNSESGLDASRLKYETLEKTLKNPVLTEFPKWESEERYATGVISAFDAISDAFDNAVDDLDLPNQFPAKLAEDSPNYELFQFVRDTLDSILSKAESVKSDFRSEAEGRKGDVQSLLENWNKELDAKRAEYEATIEGLGEQDVRRAQARLRNLRLRLDDLEGKDKGRDALALKRKQLQNERDVLLQALADSRNSRFEKRRQKVLDWQHRFHERIKLQVASSSNRREYSAYLKELVRGSRLRDADLLTIANAVPPRELVSIVLSSDSELLANTTALKTELCQKVIFALQAIPLRDLMELETTRLEDSLRIEYLAELGRYKALNELSVGGKGTVILSLALIEGDAPLVIDQPEEPLDTLAIHEQIVSTLRKEKESRQFIFTTHNPNVAVGGDAELNYVLEASADQGRVRSSGGVDHEETNRLLLHHLEGGTQAFELRRRKYLR